MNGKVWIEDMEAGKVFNGYDFMGSVEWEDYGGDACWMEPDEAEQIIKDLEAADEPAEPRDLMMEMFQHSLDAAVTDRDDFGHQWDTLVKDGNRPDAAHRMYIRYQNAQGFLEGLTNAIFIAGYRIISSVDSTKLTIAK